ncbi:hypothetical protein LSCM1_04134 [Leishmania martiniquensis]|uniref:Uncharacterized protein n=1 Tax=Leishmania martiniquensis TaxID=1580590 RepID=A0A836GMB7_9TRYP|nr:hypothetical protein LSCM1_04134 [Leishmania martiniquensis]
MSDSDWEVLSSDGELHGAPPLRSALTTSTVTARSTTASGDGGVQEGAARDLMNEATRQAILTPLCLTLNQTGTRLGVGHTRGFLVFRLVSAAGAHKGSEMEAAATTPAVPPWTAQDKRPARGLAANAAGELRALPTQSQLLLDPQYNVDLLTFSHIRERMRQEQQDRAGKAACSSPPQSTTRAPPSRASPAVMPEGAAGCSHAPQCIAASEASVPSLCDEVLSEDDSGRSEYGGSLAIDIENDLSSFLTTAGRAFAQIRRDRQGLSSRKSTWVTGSEPLDQRQGETAASGPAPSASAAAASGHGSEAAHATGACNALAEAPVTMGQTCPSPRTRLAPGPSTVLEWSKDEDIAVDPSSSDVDPVAVQRIDTCAPSSRASSSSVAAGHQAHDGAGESEDDYVGFEGGGVAVMAFLYEQTWMALVGGGPTPMGTPKCVQFIRDGELQHQLLMPDPVVRLFLDARLLFVITTAQLRMYTNPIEREWTCLRQWLPLSAAVASRYAFVAPPADGNPSANVPMRVWDKLPSPDPSLSTANSSAAVESAEDLCAAPFSSLGSRTGGQGAWATAISLPIIPVVVDYARSLVLLPAGEEGKGFALYRYVSGPEVRYTDRVSSTDMSTSASACRMGLGSAAGEPLSTGRTTSFLQHIATQSAAHRNPLFTLALYVGWPSSIARLLSPDTESGAGDQASGLMSSGHLDGSSTSWPVTLVAASSEYATRLTLWMLQEQQHDMPSPRNDCPTSSPAAGAGAGDAAAFVLLREFRVGVRLAAPQVVMASLPGVSRYIARGNAALAGTSGRASTGGRGASTETASLTGAGLLKNVSAAGDAGRPRGTATSASASGLLIATSSPPSSASHTGTMALWATEAAAAVASSTTRPAAVHHLQFVGNGAYLLCVHGADVISIFSTSARETEQEAKNVCRDRVAAEQNRYSRLSIMKEYLPRALSSRLEAYTRQAWSSCSGRLPSADPTFMPRWICAQRRDTPATKATPTASVPTAAPTPTSGSHGTRSVGASTTTTNCSSIHRKGRFFHRLTSLVGSRPPTAFSASPPSACAQTTAPAGGGEDQPSARIPPSCAASAGRSRPSRAIASQRLVGPGAPLTFPSSSLDCKRHLAVGGGWGTPLTDLPQCVQVWSSAPHAGNGASHLYTGTASATSSPKRPPIVLNCATCEGAFTNILLFAEEGEVVTSQVMPYVAS